jgi:DNA-binding HxlR family transcriptional regulator
MTTTKRSYDQNCAVATALDALGDRWALLIVRELLLGPLRYGEISALVPGINTSQLADRLADLENDAIIERRPVPLPERGMAYQLTTAGLDLEPVVIALARWASQHLPIPTNGATVRPTVAALLLKESLHRLPSLDIFTATLDIDGQLLTVRADEQRAVTIHAGPTDDADANLKFPGTTFYDIAAKRQPWPKTGEQTRIQTSGNRKTIATLKTAIQQIT